MAVSRLIMPVEVAFFGNQKNVYVAWCARLPLLATINCNAKLERCRNGSQNIFLLCMKVVPLQDIVAKSFTCCMVRHIATTGNRKF